jgi:ribose-phosphate pyrophosphokinase
MELLVGDVKDKVTVLHPNPPTLSLTPHQVALLVDDMIDSGTTLSLAARTLQEKGAKAIYALISHGDYSRFFLRIVIETAISGLLSETNLSLIDELPIVQLVVTNTIPQRQHQALCKKLVTIDVSPTIAESIRRTHNGESISLLFGEWAETTGVEVLWNVESR